MIRLYDTGAYLLNGTELIEDNADAAARLHQALGAQVPSKEQEDKIARKMEKLKGKRQRIRSHIRFSVTTIRPEIWKS